MNWVALGFGVLMDDNTDMFLVDRQIANRSAFEVTDLISKSYDYPKKDASQDYFLQNYELNATHLQVQVSRPLKTNDTDDKAIDLDTEIQMMYAFKGGEFSYHFNNLGYFTVYINGTSEKV